MPEILALFGCQFDEIDFALLLPEDGHCPLRHIFGNILFIPVFHIDPENLGHLFQFVDIFDRVA